MKNISKQITFKIANDAIQSESIEQANAVKPAKINLLSRFKSKKVVMLKRMSVMLLSLVVCMSMMPAMAFADAPDHVGGGTVEEPEPTMETVSINLAEGNTDNENYLIKDDKIWLKKRNVQYVLEGTTNKQINFWGISKPEENMKPVYVSLKNGTVLQNGFNTNVVPTTLVLEIPDGTKSTVSQIAAVDLTIKGNGTLHSNYIGVNQYKSKPEWQKLRITDTTVVVNPPTEGKSSSNVWEGTCVLDGSADVTLVSNSNESSLKVGQGKGPHSVSLRGSAKLQCLQSEMDNPASSEVSGLELFGTTSLTLEDSSYLKAQGRNSTGEYLGAAIMSYGDITVKGNAVVDTAAYGDVICTNGAFVMDGGKVLSNSKSGAGIWSGSIDIKNATVQCTSDNGVGMGSSGTIRITDSNVVTESKNSNGIYSAQSEVSVCNSEIKAKGKYPAIYGKTGLTVSGSTIDAEGTDDCALYSPADLKINDSTVKAKAPDGQNGILSNGKVAVNGSWIETSGAEKFENAISDSVLFSNKKGTVIGKFVAKHDVKVGSDMSLHIPENATLTIPNGKTFGNEGTITNEGTIKNEGTVKNAGTIKNEGTIKIAGTFTNQGEGKTKCKDGHHIGGTATTTKRAKCEICGEEYGDLLPTPAHHGTTSYVPPVEKPNVQVNDGGKTELSKDGKTLTITPGENKAIDKVLLNGKNLGAVTEVKNLKTGDKVEVIFKDKVVEPTKEELAEKVRGFVNDLSKKLTMSKTSEKSRRITVLGDASEIKDMGYTVKYTFYKKGPKDKKYKAIRTTTNNQYKFSKLKNGINRFRARIKVYDKDGKLMASKMTVIKTAKVKKK